MKKNFIKPNIRTVLLFDLVQDFENDQYEKSEEVSQLNKEKDLDTVYGEYGSLESRYFLVLSLLEALLHEK